MLFPKPVGNTLPLNLFFSTHSLQSNSEFFTLFVLSVIEDEHELRWFHFTTFNKSSYTISIVTMSLTFDFTNVDFIIIFIGLSFSLSQKKNRISCTWRSQYWYTSIVHNTGTQNLFQYCDFFSKFCAIIPVM